jgi:hypothetical protein
MIKYKLVCKGCELIFDSWFASSKEYEKLKKKNFLVCHSCNSEKVEKTLMSPQLINNQKNSKNGLDSLKYNDLKKNIKNYQKFIKDNFKYVGKNFVHEARSIHYDKKKSKKGIYGTASETDIKELKEEGIETQIIPWIGEKDN